VEVDQHGRVICEPARGVRVLGVAPHLEARAVHGARGVERDEGLDLEHALRALCELRGGHATHRQRHDVHHVRGLDGDVAARDAGRVEDGFSVQVKGEDEGDLEGVVQQRVGDEAGEELGERGRGFFADEFVDRPGDVLVDECRCGGGVVPLFLLALEG
jgi:hypothetical protein